MAGILANSRKGWGARFAVVAIVSTVMLLVVGAGSSPAGSGCAAYSPGESPGFSMGDSTSVLGKEGLEKAYSYGCEWGQSNNEAKYFHYNEDSADFASQLLKAAGVKESEKYNWNDQRAWYAESLYEKKDARYGTPPLHSQSWASASALYNHLIVTGEGVVAPEQTEASTRAGDLIFWSWNPVGGQYNDVSMVVSGDGTNPATEVVASHIPGPGVSGREVKASLPGLTNMTNLLGSLGTYLNALTVFNTNKYGTSVTCPSSDSGTGGASGTCWQWTIVRMVATAEPPGPNAPSEMDGGVNPSELAGCQVCQGDPVDSATGELIESANDFSIPGRGPSLMLTRTYGSLSASTIGPFGYGWTDSYNMKMTEDPVNHSVEDIHQENGSVVRFGQLEGESGPWKPVLQNSEGKWVAATRVLASLEKTGEGWTFTRKKTSIFKFNTSGRLISESDLNSDTTTLAYNTSGQLETVTDPAERKLTFSYSGENVSQVEDSDGRTVKYHYDEHGNLTEVTDATGAVTKYGYDSAHHMTTVTSPNGGTTTNTYDESGRVTAQTDPLGHTTTWSYNMNPEVSGTVAITDPEGTVTLESYTNGDLMTSTKPYTTSNEYTSLGAPESTTTYAYDPVTNGQTSITNADGETTTYTYDANGDRLSETDPLGNKTEWTYNEYDEVASITPPATYGGKKATTTYTYDQPEYSSGGKDNLTSVSTPIYSPTGESEGTQVTHYVHGNSSHPGDVTSMIDPRGNTWTYTYDGYGDKISETAPATSDNSESSGSHQNVTKWAYNTLTGWVTAKLSGRYTLAHPSETTCTPPAAGCTTYTYDNTGRLLTTTDGNGHTTTKHYDHDGNLEYEIDANSNKTSYEYNLADQLIATTRPDKSVLKTDYWPGGMVGDQIDANGDETHYNYDALEHLSSITDPDGHTTGYQYGPLGELLVKSDPRTTYCSRQSTLDGCTTYEYDPDGHQTAIHYNDSGTHNVTVSYDANGRRTSMTDASGTSTWAYDSLGRVTETTNGAGAKISYTYDPAGEVTSITYPGSTGTVKRAYDPAGRLESITDWKGNTTTFQYDAEGNLAKGTDPTTGTALTDTYTFDNAGAISGITTAQGSTNLATFSYKRDNANQLKEATASGALSESNTYAYNSLEQLSETNGSKYTYDPANRLTEQPGSIKQAYDPAGELTPQTNGPASINYTYDEKGERTSAIPNPESTAPNYGYTYNQAGELASVAQTPTTGPHALIDEGADTTFLVRGDGSVTAAGANAHGQLGDGTTTERHTPEAILALHNVRSIASGTNALGASTNDTLAVTWSGQLWGTGANTDGELGNGTTTGRSQFEQVSGLANVAGAAEGENFSLAVESNGNVYSWGKNTNGELGLGNTTEEHTPQQITTLSNVTQVAATDASGFALKSNGTVWSWGYDGHGQLGNGETMNETSPHEIPGLTGVTQIAAGHQFVVAVKSNGTVWSWGANSSGKLGDGTTTEKLSPVEVKTPEGVDITQVAAGRSFAAALSQSGTLYVWGSNSNGQFANGKEGATEESDVPVQITSISGATQIAAGDLSLAAIVNGTLEVWGADGYGQLGDNTTANKDIPEQVNAFNEGTRTALTEGADTTFLVRDDGRVMAAGANAHGQLGDGTTTERHTPEAILALHNVRSIASGTNALGASSNDTLAVTWSGQLWGTGANTDGELGNGTTTARSQFEQISGLSNVIGAAEGENFSLAVESNGNIYSWGKNTNGELGLGTTTEEHTPQQITTLSNVTQIAATDASSFALESNGTVWSWGYDGHGQLGDGKTTSETGPHEIPGLTGVTQIAAGHQFVIAVKSNGTVYSWGANTSGKLGDGTTTEKLSPVQIKTLEGVDIVQVTAGKSFAAAISQSGSLYAWGSNSNGQYGNGKEGATEESDVPVQITGVSGATQIAAGDVSLAAIVNGGVEVWGGDTSGQIGDNATANKDTPQKAPGFEQGVFSTATYTYNGEGLRTSKTVNGNTENFTWDTTTSSIPLILTGGSTSYIYGPDGTPLEQENASGELLWYHHDQQGSTRLLTNNTGAIAGTATYNAYGQTTSTTGTTTPLGYDGQYTDPETGLIYLRARYYDPSSGQFITRDPATSITTEPYSFASDSPLNFTDPTGLGAVGQWIENNSAAISGVSGAIAIGTAFVGLEPVALAAGAVSVATGAIATRQAFSNGETFNGIVDGLGVVFGGASMVSDVAKSWSVDRAIVKAFTDETDEAFDKAWSTVERIKDLKKAAQTLDALHGAGELARRYEEDIEKWAEANGYGCVAFKK
jgi:RHS repeat-associated protein